MGNGDTTLLKNVFFLAECDSDFPTMTTTKHAQLIESKTI
jgi:hypothetical protein